MGASAGSRKRAGRAARLAIVVLLAVSYPVSAQEPEPRIGPVAVEGKWAFAGYGPTPEQAAAIGYAETDLPRRGMGFDLGAHVYPFKLGAVTLGLGGNLLFTSGHSAPQNEKGEPTGREADTRFRSVAAQLSVNFGSGHGWSYLSGGIGYSTFVIFNKDVPEPASPPKRQTINYGGGGRWELRQHLAFSLDFRFYKLAAQEAAAGVPADAGTTRFVLSAGLAYK